MAGEVKLLADEIGVKFKPEHDTERFRARWAYELARAVMNSGLCARSAHRESALSWLLQIGDASDADMPGTLRRVREEIEAVDSDDGWATDPACAAVEHVACSLLPDTRWMAHAGNYIWGHVTGAGLSFNEVVKFSREAWLRSVYERCATYAPEVRSPAGTAGQS